MFRFNVCLQKTPPNLWQKSAFSSARNAGIFRMSFHFSLKKSMFSTKIGERKRKRNKSVEGKNRGTSSRRSLRPTLFSTHWRPRYTWGRRVDSSAEEKLLRSQELNKKISKSSLAWQLDVTGGYAFWIDVLLFYDILGMFRVEIPYTFSLSKDAARSPWLRRTLCPCCSASSWSSAAGRRWWIPWSESPCQSQQKWWLQVIASCESRSCKHATKN